MKRRMVGLAVLVLMLSLAVSADAAGWRGGCYSHCSAPCQYTYRTEYCPVQRTICEMRLQGYSVAEIAARVRCGEATVFRELNAIQDRLQILLRAFSE